MFAALTRRLLPLLQLTRMALVFTAIADSFCTMLLLSQSPLGGPQVLEPTRMLAVAAMSIALYGFGMSLNDIIDRRRDRQIASHRPLPSGRVGVVTAHVICSLLAVAAIGAAAIYSRASGTWMSLMLLVWAELLIVFYDMAGKYLVAPGLLTLGLIRFFHALVPGPGVPVLWHPLLLFNHVTVISTVAYVWEQKRPPLTKIHWWFVLGGLAVIDVAAIVVYSGVAARRGTPGLAMTPWLALPAAGVVAFVIVAWVLRRRSPSSRDAGQALMLYGLLWLIVYDAAFALAYVGWVQALLLVVLLPVAYLSVQLMRWWSKLIAISQRPEFKRA